MKITSIRPQIRNPERASIFVDRKYALSLTLSELVAEKLKIGQEIDEPELKRLKKISDDGKLKMRALEWVMSRPRSVREFKNYMFRKKAESELTEKLIEEFTDRGYMNEQRFAEWLADVRRRKGKSDRAIRLELSSKGIDREVVEETVNDGSELKRLKDLVTKKGRLPRYKADPQKFKQYLARQGFSYDDIKIVLRKSTD